MFELMDSVAQEAVIKVIGVGGGGGNAVQHMVTSGISGVDFICANTDAQALSKMTDAKSLQIGCNITKGLGAGATPETGQQAALEDRELIQEAIETLPEKYYTAIVLRHNEEKSCEEIAEILDLPLGTVKARIFRAREMLNKALKDRLH